MIIAALCNTHNCERKIFHCLITVCMCVFVYMEERVCFFFWTHCAISHNTWAEPSRVAL